MTTDWATKAAEEVLGVCYTKDERRIASIISTHAEPLVALLRGSKRNCTTACRAYGNYQPPYEECTCGADAWNARVDAALNGDADAGAIEDSARAWRELFETAKVRAEAAEAALQTVREERDAIFANGLAFETMARERTQELQQECRAREQAEAALQTAQQERDQYQDEILRLDKKLDAAESVLQTVRDERDEEHRDALAALLALVAVRQREKALREIIDGLAKRHEGYGIGEGTCRCKWHVEAYAALAAVDPAVPPQTTERDAREPGNPKS